MALFSPSIGLFLPLLGVVILVYSVVNLYRLLVNYWAAKTIGIPIIVAPFTWQNPLWILASPAFMWLQYLPFGLGRWVNYSTFGWCMADRTAIHDELGVAFTIVSFTGNEVWLADPTAVLEVTGKWRVYTEPQHVYQLFEVFGPNVNTVNGENWQRHRKIAAVAFKERNCKLVWDETWRQADQLLTATQKRGDLTMLDVTSDFILLAMHVLSAAVLGHTYNFGSGLDKADAGHSLSYLSSLEFMLRNLLMTSLFKDIQLPRWLMPRKLKQMKLSVKEFRDYMRESVESQQKVGSNIEGGDLISALVNANELAKEESKTAGGRVMNLSQEELYSNLFMFNLAGFETTSTTVTFTIPYLAANPALQDWVREEVDSVAREGKLASYEDAFPLLPRTLSLMYEVLRLHSAIAGLPRITPSTHSVALPLGPASSPSHRMLTIPPNTITSVNFYALHLLPSLWGPDASQYKPQRWVQKVPESNNKSNTNAKAGNSPQYGITSLLGERLKAEPSPVKNPEDSVTDGPAIYMPWYHGPRVCPGKKFSQVEYVAIMASIMSRVRIEPVGDVLGLLNDTWFNVTPEFTRPKDAGVRYVPR